MNDCPGKILLKHFEKIYIINLKTRIDRRKKVEKELEKIGLHSNNNKIQFFNAIRPSEPAGFRTIGARGCFLSHLGILLDAHDKQYNSILILEDDIRFSENIRSAIVRIDMELSQASWDIFYGGYNENLMAKNFFGNSCLVKLQPEMGVQCTHFVAFKNRVVERMIQHLETLLSRDEGDPLGGPMDVDGAYTWFRSHNSDINTYISSPPIGYQRSSSSDVTNKKWFDKTPLLSSIVSLLRKIKYLFSE